MNLEDFEKNGFIKFDELLSANECNILYSKIKQSRNWGKELFLSEEEYNKDPNPDRANPGKNIQNLVSNYNLDFIENNPQIKRILTNLLGNDYEILLTKFVVAVSSDWMPKYVEEMNKKEPLSNFNKFIKKEFRDVTYFRGLDLHMDSIDWENANNKFITMYVYLNEVDHSMSPLEIVKGSHKLGHTQHPHYIEKIKNSNEIKYSLDNKKFLKFEKEKLVGASGSVYFWTSNTLHGTAESKESKESFRISLRYIIDKRKNSTGLIDKVIDQEKVGKTR